VGCFFVVSELFCEKSFVFPPGGFCFSGIRGLLVGAMRYDATTLPPMRDMNNIMKKTSVPLHLIILTSATAWIFCAGCKGTLGTDSVNVSGSVLTHGTLIGGSLTVASNTVSVGGTVAQNGATNGGSFSVGY
jgi:hypothetical protein